MRLYYLDSSALAKHYLIEPGSRWITELITNTAPARFVSTELAIVEVVCAITQRGTRKAHQRLVSKQPGGTFCERDP